MYSQKINLKIFKLIECRLPLICLIKSPLHNICQSLKSDIILLLQLGLAPDCPLFVDVLHHAVDVGGQQVVHLVAQGRLAQQLGALDQVADGHVEVSVATGPVGNLAEGKRHENILRKLDIIFSMMRVRQQYDISTLVCLSTRLTPFLFMATNRSSG